MLEARDSILDHANVKEVHWFLGESAPKFYYNFTGNRENQSHYAQAMVKLNTESALGEFNLIPELANIARRNEQRVNTVQGYITAGVLPSVVLAKFQEKLAENNFQLPTGYRYEFGGEQEESSTATGNLALYVPLLLVVMMTALVLCLGSFRQTGIVAVVAVGCIGMALFSLKVSGSPLGFMAIVGTMGLFGRYCH